MHKYTITFRRPDCTQFETEYHGYDFEHACEAAKVCLARSLGETDLVAVAYVRA